MPPTRGTRQLKTKTRLPFVNRRISDVAIGTFIGQLALFASSPILTRLYTPDEFGQFALYFSIINSLGAVATLRYEIIIPKAKNSSSALTALTASILASIVASTIASAVLLAVASTTGLGAHTDYLLIGLIPLALLLIGWNNSLSFWLAWEGSFKTIGLNRAITGVGSSAGQLAFGCCKLGGLGLATGDLLARITTTLWLAIHTRALHLSGLPTRRIKAAISHLVMHRSCFTLSTPALLINSTSQALPLLLTSIWYDAATAGALFLAQRIVNIPSGVLSYALSQAYITEVAMAENSQIAFIIYRKSIIRAALLAVAPLTIIGLLGPTTFSIIFGTEWHAAGTLSAMLVPYYFFQLLSGSTISTLEIIGQYKARIIREVILLLTTATPFLVGRNMGWDIYYIVGFYSLSGTLFYAFSLIQISILLKRKQS